MLRFRGIRTAVTVAIVCMATVASKVGLAEGPFPGRIPGSQLYVAITGR
jgi:hypothetical protein